MSRAFILVNVRSDGDEPSFGDPLGDEYVASTCLLDIDLGLERLAKDLIVEVSEVFL
jgi:hypothetical protein